MNKSVGYLKAASLVALIASCNAALAKDLGVIGKSYPIIERDLVEVIHERIQQKTESADQGALFYRRGRPGAG